VYRERESTTTFLNFITATLHKLNSLVHRQTTLKFKYSSFAVFLRPCPPDSKTSKMSQKQTPQPLSVNCASEDNVSEVNIFFYFI